jgi:transcriptional regulator CtsR
MLIGLFFVTRYILSILNKPIKNGSLKLAKFHLCVYNNVNIGQRGCKSVAEQNMSDFIEAYLKQILDDMDQIEIRRSEIAERFNVVPSQINYVIKTRFTLRNGYLVESKRGGGGYIRIERVPLKKDRRFIEELIVSLDDEVTVRQAAEVLDTLVRLEILTAREVDLTMSMLTKEALDVGNVQVSDRLRARLLRQLLNRLRFESERD